MDFTCSLCGKSHVSGESEYTCLSCGPSGILEPSELTISAVSHLPVTSSPGMWRYEQLLALSPTAPRPPLPVGGTPLLDATRLAHRLGLSHLSIKNDSLNPTGSLKDRASAVALARAAEIGAERVAATCASVARPAPA